MNYEKKYLPFSLKSIEPWLLIIAVVMGNGGIFCWCSYINPLLVKVSGISLHQIQLPPLF